MRAFVEARYHNVIHGPSFGTPLCGSVYVDFVANIAAPVSSPGGCGTAASKKSLQFIPISAGITF